MGCYNRTKFGFDFTKRVVSLFNNAVGEPFLERGHILNQNQTNPFGGKRFYCDGKNQNTKTRPNQHPKPRPTSLWQLFESLDEELLHNLEKPFYSWETIPFTKRKHYVLSTFIERLMVPRLRHGNGEKILPPKHPVSLRLNLVAQNIIVSLYQLLRGQFSNDPISQGALNILKESLNWKVVVLYDDRMLAYCDYGGNIFMYTGMLNHLRSEAEVAFVIAHEIAHILARHVAEKDAVFTWLGLPWICITQLVMSYSIIPLDMSLIISLYSCGLVNLHFHRKMELEADYIALVLMASAGYDPRVAPPLTERLSGTKPWWYYYFSTHPCGKKRAQCMRQPKVMEEALLIYRGSRARKDA